MKIKEIKLKCLGAYTYVWIYIDVYRVWLITVNIYIYINMMKNYQRKVTLHSNGSTYQQTMKHAICAFLWSVAFTHILPCFFTSTWETIHEQPGGDVIILKNNTK